MKNVITTAAVIGALLFGTGALLFALANETVGVSTVQQQHHGPHNSARHASLPPVW
jgi:Spy/CpxP family protein refolding chaperone